MLYKLSDLARLTGYCAHTLNTLLCNGMFSHIKKVKITDHNRHKALTYYDNVTRADIAKIIRIKNTRKKGRRKNDN